ncbi:FtsH protease activity modulator HflK [Kaarinaea lacus]
MAWNEPGGSGDKDPWGGGGRGGKDQGPPDLDEVVRNLQKKFGGIFGGGKGGTGGGGGGKTGSLSFGLIGAILVAIWGFSGLYTVEEGTRGVVLQFGQYNKTTMPGLQWYPRFIQSVEVVDIEQIRGMSIGFRSGTSARATTVGSTVGRESLMLTQDENIVDVKLAVQYKVKSASDYLFKVLDPETTLRQAIESAIREIIGKSKMDFILREGRADITARARELIQTILDRYETGLQVTTVNLQDAQPPEQVQDAFADAVKAREDQVRVTNEAEAYANDIIPKARGNAARQLAEANAYKEQVIAEATGEASRFSQVLAEYKKAPQVTRKRLYLEAVESVMSNSSKVMVDVKGGGNLLFLPLDKIMDGVTTDESMARRIFNGASSAKEEAEQKLRESIRGRSVR